MDVLFEGRLNPDLHLKTVLQRVLENKPPGNLLIRISSPNPASTGRLLVRDGRFITAALLDENDESGYPALRQLLAVGTGNFAGLRPEPGEKIDLVPNLNFELHKVIPLMPALPESPVGLFDEKSLLDKVFSTGSFEKLEQMRPTEPARPRDMEPMLPPAKPLGPLPSMQMPNSPQFQMPNSPQVQMPGTPQMQMPGTPQVQMPGTPQMPMPNNSPQVQMPGTRQGQIPSQMSQTVTPQKPVAAFTPPQTPQPQMPPPPTQVPSPQAPPMPAWQTARTQPVPSLDIPDEEFETLEREKEQAQRDTKRPAHMPVTYEGLDDLQVRGRQNAGAYCAVCRQREEFCRFTDHCYCSGHVLALSAGRSDLVLEAAQCLSAD